MNRRSMKQCLMMLLGLCWIIVAQAQQQDYSNVRVDQLTEAQITRMITEADKRGMTDEQVIQAAGQRGMSPAEQQKLRTRIATVRTTMPGGTASSTANISSTDQQERSTTQAVDPLNWMELESSLEADTGISIFGSKLFRNTNIRFEPNLNIPTPQNYIIGTGDELLLDLTGDNQVSYRLPVSPDGQINVDYVGMVPVAGLTIEAASDKIRQQMQGTYPQLSSGRTRLSLTLGNIRSIKVTLTGFATRPGTYTLPSLANVFHALYAAGGPSEKGSYRAIQVIRNNHIVATIDTYDFLTKGVQTDNVRLEDGDVIHIPVFQRHVSIEGLVNNPGIFETLEDESLSDLIGFAGDFAPEAYSAKVKVLRFTDRERSVADVYAADFDTHTPRNGDQYVVEEVLDRFANRVEIEGAVFRPGYYALQEGLTLSQLIKQAEGLKEDAFMGRAYINRLNPDNTQQLLTVNLERLMAGDAQQDHVLRREDRIIISSIFDLREEYTVSLNGQVRRPGEFPYVDDMTLGSLIQMGGGLAEAANIEHVDIARRLRRNTNEQGTALAEVVRVNFDSREEAVESDFVLQPFDIVSIHTSTGYQVQRMVRIEGEVQFPGEYALLEKGETIADLIRRAGGVTEYAYLEGASLQRHASDAMIAQGHSALAGQSRRDIREMEAEQDALQAQALGNISASDSTEDVLFFSNYVGIRLDRILDGQKRYDLPLEDEDVIIVPRELRTVMVRGQVLNPNRVVYQPGKSLKYYINQAGGFTSRAHKRKTFVQHANGAVQGSRIGHPPVHPGSEIIVPTKPEREPMSVQAWVSVGSVVTSLAAVVVSLMRVTR